MGAITILMMYEMIGGETVAPAEAAIYPDNVTASRRGVQSITASQRGVQSITLAKHGVQSATIGKNVTRN